jgi:DNA-binding transcriptional LysR family regulator
MLVRHELGAAAIGAGPHPAAALVPQLLSRAIADYPKLKVSVEVAQPEILLEQLLREQLDFFIAATNNLILGEELVVKPLRTPRLACFVAAGHPLLRKKKLNQELQNYPWMATRASSSIRDTLFAGLPIQHNSPPAVMCEDLFLLIKIAQQTHTILIAPYEAVTDEVKSGRLVALPLNPVLFEQVNFGVVRLARRTPSPAAQLLMDLIDRLEAGLASHKTVRRLRRKT